MRILTLTGYLALTAHLVSCDRQQAAPDIDPGLGRECFESNRAILPPGTQYEGINEVTEKRLTIRIMNGVDVTTIDCRLNPDGTLQNTGQ